MNLAILTRAIPPRADGPKRPASGFGRRAEAPMLILAHGERVRAARLSPRLIGAFSALTVLLAAWVVGATAYVLFHEDVREATNHYLVDNQRGYEDSIASLRRQIDEINGRQFLDQTTVERRLESLRERQASLEERQMRIASLVEGARARNVTLRMSRPVSVARSAFDVGPLLAARPRPESNSLMAGLRASSDPTGRTIEAIDTSLESVSEAQTATLTAIEDSLDETFDTLAAISQAVDSPLPEFAQGDAEFGTGGPLVELRGLVAETPMDDQISQLEAALEQLDTLKSHVRHLPVRMPLEGNPRRSSGYGTRVDPFLGRPALHTGLDFRARRGTPVLAVAAGRVVTAAYSGGYGKLVEIDHGNGYTTRYAHLSEIAVARGARVEPGDTVGKVGSTGRSTGPHLHYETRHNGRPRNPAVYVDTAKLVPEGF